MVIAPCYYIDYFHVDNSSLESDLIEPDDLIFFTNDQLRYLRNVIYAWHGHTFDSADLK
ncbi:MAG: YARHG domain-containing protein, partial [Bacteroidaceae bacterium]|nr:YARHG domain-containing protein [Bacteroidaceae bacterium]